MSRKFSMSEAETIKKAGAFVNERVKTLQANGHDVFFYIDKTKGCVLCVDVLIGAVGVAPKIGMSQCAPDDRFVTPIGKAIALCRAFDKKIPSEFLHLMVM